MTLTGPDLSHWQGSVNFAAIRRAGHSLVILKATDGDGNIDPSFPANRAAAHAAGLAVGAYHFAEGGDPIAEAEHFCTVTDPLAAGELVVLDWEVAGSNPVGWCLAWLDHIAAKCNVRPLLYINQSRRDAYNWAPVVAAGHGLWLARYDNSLTQPPSGAWPAVSMKQYTDQGTVPGVSSPCDVNVFYGDATALAALGHNPTTGGSFMAGLTDAEQTEMRDILRELRWVKPPYVKNPTHLVDAVGDIFVNARTAAKPVDPAAIAAAVVAALPASSGGSGPSVADIQAAVEAELRKVLGSLDNTPAS